MELRHLRYFLAVAREQHFRRASEMLHVSQPAVSEQIKQLEEELGTLLFDRSGRGVKLTPAGQLFKRYARQTLNRLEEARVAIDELEGLKRGTLTVGVVQTVNAYLIPSVIARFTSDFPDIKVYVEELTMDEIEEKLMEGELQLALGFHPTEFHRIVSLPLFEEELVLITPIGHPLATFDSIDLDKITGHPLILLSEGFCTRRAIDQAFRQANCSPRVAVEMNSITGILSAIQAAGTATILPSFALRESGFELRGIRLKNPSISRTVAVLRGKSQYRCSASLAFEETINTEWKRLQSEVEAGDHLLTPG